MTGASLTIQLLSVLIAALGLRMIGITHGLPHVYEHDEIHAVLTALRHGSGDLAPPNFLHGSLLSYVLAVLFGLYYILGRLQGHFRTTEDLLAQYVHDPTAFYLIGRIAVAVLGTVVVGATYAAARRLYDARVGLLAAAFVSVSVLHVNMSHLIKEDILATALLSLAFVWIAGVTTRHGRNEPVGWRAYGVGGVLVGLAISAKYYSGPAMIWLAILAWAEVRGRPAGEAIRVGVGRVLVGLSGVGAGFLVGQPYALLWPTAFLRDVFGQWTQYSYIPNPGGKSSALLYLADYLPDSVGLPLVIASAAGCLLGWLGRKNRLGLLLVMSFPALWIAVLLRSSAFPHFLTPVIPFLFMPAAILVVWMADWIPGTGRWRAWAMAGLALLLLLPPLLSSLRYDRYALGEDTRKLAKDWIEANIQPGERIAIEGAVFEFIVFAPPLKADRGTLEAELAEIKRRGGNGRLWQAKLARARAGEAAEFSLCKTQELSLAEVERCGARVAVVVTDSADRSWSAIPHDRRQFLREMEARYALVMQFDPYPGLRFFPTMWTLREEFQRLRLVGTLTNPMPLVTGPRVRVFRAREGPV